MFFLAMLLVMLIASSWGFPHADNTKKRILFVDHWPGRIPQLEALEIAKGIAKKNKQPHTILV